MKSPNGHPILCPTMSLKTMGVGGSLLKHLMKFVQILMLASLVAACGTSTETETVSPGGKPGTSCNAFIHSEGCNGDQRVRCDKSNSTWVAINTCGSGTICQTGSDPLSSGGTGQISSCVSATSPDAVAGTASCGDGKCTSGETTAGCLKDCPLNAGYGCNLSSDHNYFTPLVSTTSNSKWLAHHQIIMDCTFKGTCMGKLGELTQQSCISSCVKGKTGISMSCSKCMGAHEGWCAAKKCSTKCNGKVGTICVDCITEQCGKTLGKCVAGSVSSAKPKCGNSKCEAPNESASSCQNDCPILGCGNGKCDAGETSTCPSDCKAPSGTCNGKDCKFKSGATCQCDKDCAKYKDCCSDKLKYCPVE